MVAVVCVLIVLAFAEVLYGLGKRWGESWGLGFAALVVVFTLACMLWWQ